ncbi:MAG: hypothetical protein HWE20_04920 [Gammaproteobacteria bacterium]|nr:hypothetical protein [Gammaproteobacteria bacterium]
MSRVVDFSGALRVADNPLWAHTQDAQSIVIVEPPRASGLMGVPNKSKARFAFELRLAEHFVARHPEVALCIGLRAETLREALVRAGAQTLVCTQPLAFDEAALLQALRNHYKVQALPSNHLFQKPFNPKSLKSFSKFKNSQKRDADEPFESGSVPNAQTEEDHARPSALYGLGYCEGSCDQDWQRYRDHHMAAYKQTRNGLLGRDFSSKLSVSLAHGLLGVRRVWADIEECQRAHGVDAGNDWLKVEILWREYFAHYGRIMGARLYGLRQIEAQNTLHWQAWTLGKTGVPLIDAAAQELMQSGYQSNRIRQNYASYAIHELGLDWRAVATHFEAHLFDYDPHSNWGNCAYIAGVNRGSAKHFDVIWQAKHYDPEGAYIRHWLGDFKNHTPWEQGESKPIVSPMTQDQFNATGLV